MPSHIKQLDKTRRTCYHDNMTTKTYRSVRVAQALTNTLNEALIEATLDDNYNLKDRRDLELEYVRSRAYTIELMQALGVN